MLTYKEENKVKRWFAEAEVAYLAEKRLGDPAEKLQTILSEQPETDRFRRRWQALQAFAEQKTEPTPDASYVRRWGFGGVRVFKSGDGLVIYQISIRSFPGHDTHCYLIDGTESTLIDIGSGLASNHQDWIDRRSILQRVFGVDVSGNTLRHLVISHGHVDHYGYLPKLLESARPAIYCHELDARVLEQFDERIVLAGRDLRRYLQQSGLSPDTIKTSMELFAGGREYFRNCAVDVRLTHGASIPNGGRVIHTPGHCAGLICIRFNDLLFTADHVLQDVTPHQAPQFLNPFFGLENYFSSLQEVSNLDGIRVGLPSHGPLIHNLRERVQEILYFHQRRLGQVLELCEQPRTIAEIAEALFGELSGYNVILGIEEAGAHVEYLHQHGWLRVVNVDQLHQAATEVIYYQQDAEAMKRRKEPTVRSKPS